MAFRMAIIAFLVSNIAIGTLYGPFSVLLIDVEARLGVGRELSTLGVPAMNLAMAICAPLAGVLAARISLRLLMMIGTVLGMLGFVLLATTHVYAFYLIAYGLFLGPFMAFGVILPPTLITRWFVSGRGRALGLISMPIVITVLPLASIAVLKAFSLDGVYWLLAAICAVAVVASLFVVDRPPVEIAVAETETAVMDPKSDDTLSAPAIWRSMRFWAIALVSVVVNAGTVILAAHMMPMAQTWGFSPTLAASLITVQMIAGIAGTLLFGWIGDKLGGVKTLALIAFDAVILWMLLLAHPPFPLLVVVIGFMGVHGAGILPVVGLALSQTFGHQNFSRVYGLTNFLNLPFSVACVPAAAFVYTTTGSYNGAIIGQSILLASVALFALSALSVRQQRPAGLVGQ